MLNWVEIKEDGSNMPSLIDCTWNSESEKLCLWTDNNKLIYGKLLGDGANKKPEDRSKPFWVDVNKNNCRIADCVTHYAYANTPERIVNTDLIYLDTEYTWPLEINNGDSNWKRKCEIIANMLGWKNADISAHKINLDVTVTHRYEVQQSPEESNA